MIWEKYRFTPKKHVSEFLDFFDTEITAKTKLKVTLKVDFYLVNQQEKNLKCFFHHFLTCMYI